MKTDEVIYYEKVVLDDKELPEESGDYLCKWIQDSTQNIIISEMKFNKDDSRSIIFWNEFVFWYLRPTSLRDVLKDFNSFMCGKQYDGRIPLIDTCIDEYINSKK